MATRRKPPFLVFFFFSVLSIPILTLCGFTFAEVVTDGTLGGSKGPVGPGTIPGVGTTTYHITDALGKQAGQNLFHSFSSFNIGKGESATGSLTVQASTVDVSDYFNASGAGTILIRAGRIILEPDPNGGGRSWITADSYGVPRGGGVNILTGTLEISGGSSIAGFRIPVCPGPPTFRPPSLPC